ILFDGALSTAGYRSPHPRNRLSPPSQRLPLGLQALQLSLQLIKPPGLLIIQIVEIGKLQQLGAHLLQPLINLRQSHVDLLVPAHSTPILRRRARTMRAGSDRPEWCPSSGPGSPATTPTVGVVVGKPEERSA